ncbi:MAG: hypothetical protein HYX48_00420 [Chlamydiales bacterium]|nr:hypothetical protein [Chlamydiales bacterium]
MIKALFFSLLLLSGSSAFASSVRLVNDSPTKLRAVVRGSSGNNLGEMMIEPNQSTTWTDQYDTTGNLQKGNIYQNQPSKSQTPYTVLWYCMDGNDFSFCEYVNTGNTVTAKGCAGTRQCKLVKKKEQQEPEEHEAFFERDAKREQDAVGPPKY